MNPSTAEILAAVDGLKSDQVVILPNNKNIRPVAERVDELHDQVGAGRPDGLDRRRASQPSSRTTRHRTPNANAEAMNALGGPGGSPAR